MSKPQTFFDAKQWGDTKARIEDLAQFALQSTLNIIPKVLGF